MAPKKIIQKKTKLQINCTPTVCFKIPGERGRCVFSDRAKPAARPVQEWAPESRVIQGPLRRVNAGRSFLGLSVKYAAAGGLGGRL